MDKEVYHGKEYWRDQHQHTFDYDCVLVAVYVAVTCSEREHEKFESKERSSLEALWLNFKWFLTSAEIKFENVCLFIWLFVSPPVRVPVKNFGAA